MKSSCFLLTIIFCSPVIVLAKNILTVDDDNTVIVYAGELRVEINKKPWLMKIYNNNTEELIITEEDSREQQLGFGKWVGKYIDPYQGYLYRVGFMEYQYHATNVNAVTKSDDDVVVAVGTDDPRGTNITVGFSAVKDRQLSFSIRVEPPLDSNRVSWGFKILDDDEGFYGFGERFNAVNQRGEKLGCWVEDGSFGWGKFDPHIRFPGGKTSTYVPMPLFISSRKYGFQLDTYYRSEFDSRSIFDLMHITTESSSFNATLFAGSTVRETVKMMTNKNGRSLVPPIWAFGPWNQLTNEVAGKTEVDRAYQLLFEEDIPVSVSVDTVHFFPEGADRNQHQEMLTRNQQLHHLGIPSTAYYNSMITTTFNETYDYADKMRYFTQNKEGSPYQYDYLAAELFHVSQIDFTNPNATDWYQHQFNRALDVGYLGWMYDYGEYTPYDSINSLGQTGLRSHNQYPLLYQKACFDYLTQNKSKDDIYAPDFLFYVRSGYLGSQNYTWAHWTGDPSSDWTEASGLPAQLLAMLSIGVSGMPFTGSDIGGFEWYTGPSADEELWVRWTQLGCFSGYMHEQGGGKGFSRKTHIFDTKNGTALWRKYAKLRTQLLPYIYTQAHIAHHEGLPIMRHHILSFDDKEAWNYKHQYMFGENILVAPVVKPGVNQMEVYLPDGEDWIDVSSGLTYEEDEGRFRISQNEIIPGGKTITMSSPLETIPIVVRAGSVIPLLDANVQTLRHADHPNVTSIDKSRNLHIWAWPNRNNSATGQDWQGNLFRIGNSSSQGQAGLELESSVTSENYDQLIAQIAINPPGKPASVQYKNGTRLKPVTTWRDVYVAGNLNVFFYDVSKRVIWLSVPRGHIVVDILF